jgi:hypothetical protein
MQTLAQLRSGQLSGTGSLKLAENLKEFPLEILELAPTLELLNLSGNRLSALPDSFSQLSRLKILFLSDNDFTELPSILGACQNLEMIGFKANKIAKVPENAFPENLRWLILTDNEISELPGSIGHCQQLQKLMLAGNKLKELPPELTRCRNLELLRISANELSILPEWLFTLPRLAWLAFAGNPFQNSSELENNLPVIPWSELQLKEELGQGASGIISKANWIKTETGESKEVAVKVFKGHVTSDGFPADEMAACLAAGIHPNLVPVLGKIKHHPDQKQGLVLSLIPSDHSNLGNPPSFATCTRDTFPDGIIFDIKSILNIASGIAGAAAHLHACGIMHGDLYAHNILIDKTASPLFGDFGAATIYKPFKGKLAELIERIEVRAFGYLLEDLLAYLNPQKTGFKVVKKLTLLKEDCLQENISSRPDFESISVNLSEIKATLHEQPQFTITKI